jgi:hypothetical protein
LRVGTSPQITGIPPRGILASGTVINGSYL